jgi:Fe-S-cluster containining protein
MDIKNQCEQLKTIYAIYDEFTADTYRACRKHCASCCTCNVTGTTLEGWLIHDRLMSAATDHTAFLENLSEIAPPGRFQPRVTINDMVAMCMQGKSLPDEQNDPAAGVCPFMEGDTCSIYAVRPFGCRAMLSTLDCTGRAEAHMPPLILSANNVVMQYIETLDRPGASGNLIDILLFLSDPAQRRAYENRQCLQWPQSLQPNRPFPALMIPPEHRTAIQPLLQALKAALTNYHRTRLPDHHDGTSCASP